MQHNPVLLIQTNFTKHFKEVQMRGKFFLVLLAVLLASPAILVAQKAPKKSAGTTWAIKGDYVDACSCSPVCTCEFGIPMEGCEGMGAFKIKEGHYGRTSLNGATVAMYLKPGVEHALYFDESITEAQREALTKILNKSLADVGGTDLGTKTAKVNFSYGAGKASVEVPGVMTMSAEETKGMDGKKPIVLANSFNPLASKVMHGKATENDYNDYGRQYKYQGHNAWFGVIDLKGN
jgi:hypothetical protein